MPLNGVPREANAPPVFSLRPRARPFGAPRGRRGHVPPPVAEGLEAELLPDELLLDEEPRGAADPLVENLLPIREGPRLRREVVPPHLDSLAPGEAAGLDHELEVRVVHELLKGAESVERPIGGQPRDPEVPHEVPRE